jgi:hypothetical protein
MKIHKNWMNLKMMMKVKNLIKANSKNSKVILVNKMKKDKICLIERRFKLIKFLCLSN